MHSQKCLSWLSKMSFPPLQDYGTAADVFSYGVVLWELITLEQPWFNDQERPGLCSRIMPLVHGGEPAFCHSAGPSGAAPPAAHCPGHGALPARPPRGMFGDPASAQRLFVSTIIWRCVRSPAACCALHLCTVCRVSGMQITFYGNGAGWGQRPS